MRNSLTPASAGQARSTKEALMSAFKPASESSRDANQQTNEELPAAPTAASEKKVTFTIDRELAARFKRWAKAEGRLHSKLVEVCIGEYLKHHCSNKNGNSNGYRNGARPLEGSPRREDKRQNENFDTVTVSINESVLLDFRIEALRRHKRLYELAEDCFRASIPSQF